MVPLIKRSTDSLVAVIGEKATAEVTFEAIEYVCLIPATLLLSYTCIYKFLPRENFRQFCHPLSLEKILLHEFFPALEDMVIFIKIFLQKISVIIIIYKGS